MGRFDDRLTEPLPRLGDLLRIARTGGFAGPQGKRPQVEVPRAPPGPLPPVPEGGLGLTWLGHATFLVRIGGLSVLTDPVLSDRLPGRIPRLSPPGLPLEALPRVDAVVVSHNHYDHLDARTVARLPRGTPFFVPLGLGRWLRRRGFTQVTELDWWQSARLGPVAFECVPVHHWSRRGLWDTNDTLWGGWVLSAGGRKAFFGGDSGHGPRFAEVGRRHPGLDVAMLPIGAYEPRWFMRPVHMDPEEAVQACADLGAARLATMHWGTFVLTREPVLEPPERARAAWLLAGRPRADLWDLPLGGSRVLDSSGREAAAPGQAVAAVA
jgi:L-ascorbate metabolism protein UlaG (beta-lactamase superfamily)